MHVCFILILVIPEGGKHHKDCLGRSPTPPGDSSPGQLPAEVRSETTRSVMVWPPAAGYVAAKIIHNKMLHSATRRTKNPNQPHAHEPPPHIREREKREKETERKRDREKERERERERERECMEMLLKPLVLRTLPNKHSRCVNLRCHR